MSDKTVSVGLKIEGDSKSAQAAIEATEKGLQELGTREKQTTTETERLNTAFSKLGIRSAAEIEADILAINQALQRLAQSGNVSGAEFDRAFTAAQDRLTALRAEMSSLPVEPTKNSIGGLTGAFSSLQGVLGALGISAVGEKFLHSNLAADKLSKSLNAVHGDSAKAAADMEWLKDVAYRLGINLESSSGAFVKLAASAKGTSLEGQKTRDIFEGIASGMSRLGLSSAETERAFVAISQMMSKGTITAEELKGQLGDVMPGALQMMARATNLSTAELTKLMETGGLLAEDALPRFAAEVKKSFGDSGGQVDGLSNSIERVKNAWAQAFKIFGDTGVLAALGGAVAVVNEALLLMATGVTVVVAGFFALVKAAATLAAAIINLDFSNLQTSLADIGKELVGTVDKMARLTGTSKLVGEAMEGTASSTAQAAQTAKAASAGWDKLNAAYSQAVKTMADVAEQAKRIAKANDEQAEILVKLAQLSGNENALLRAKEEAAARAAEGTDRVATALENEAKALQAKQIALQEEVKGQQNVSDEKIKAIEEAKKLTEAKTEEARAARAGADVSRVAAAAQAAESAARADSSGRVNELKDAYEQAALKVDVLKVAQLSGVDVSNALKEAQVEAAKAHALLNDALADQAKKIQDTNALKQAQLSLEGTTIKLAIEQQRTIYEVARARGDEYGAMQALLQMKRLEIQLAELTANAKRLEAQAALAKVQADREELQAKGQLTEAASLELQAREAAAGVKLKEAEIAKELSKRMRELLDANQASGSAAGRSVGGYDNMANSMNRAADAAIRLRNAQGGVGGGNEGGGISQVNIGASGSVTDDPTFDHDTFNKGGRSADRGVNLTQFLYQFGGTLEEVKLAQKYIGELFEREKATRLTGNLGNEDNAARQTNLAVKFAAEQALEMARREMATGQATDLGPSVKDLMARNMAQQPIRNLEDQIAAIKRAGNEAKSATTIRLELGSGPTKSTVFADSHGDAERFIKTLEAAGMRAAR